MKSDSTVSASERRRRLRLKRIVVSEQNSRTQRLMHAGGSFNDVIMKLLRIEKNHQKKQHDSDNDSSNSSKFFPKSLSELFERDRQQLAELIRLQKKDQQEQ